MILKKGDKHYIHVCNDCVDRQGLKRKLPAESGGSSLWCEVCGHYNIGSHENVIVIDWLQLKIVRD